MSKVSLQTALNKLREEASSIFQSNVSDISTETDIGEYSRAIFSDPAIKNEFIGALVNKIVGQQVERKVFSNKLKFLEGDRLPLGQVVEDIFINPTEGRDFDGSDYAGILQKYEADVKVQYLPINLDKQYPITISDQMLKKAFLSWNNLEDFINGLTNSLYSGAYIDEYNYTKGLVTSAYKENRAIIEKVENVSTEATAKDFVTKARTLFKNFQDPTSKYNAWNKCGGVGRPVLTWTDPENIVVILRNDISSYVDVNVLASAFNMDKSILLGNIYTVADFNVYNNKRELVYDGSNIVGIIADRSWFKIRTQDFYMDNQKNANNRTWNYYLNMVKMYMMSLFANRCNFCNCFA